MSNEPVAQPVTPPAAIPPNAPSPEAAARIWRGKPNEFFRADFDNIAKALGKEHAEDCDFEIVDEPMTIDGQEVEGRTLFGKARAAAE